MRSFRFYIIIFVFLSCSCATREFGNPKIAKKENVAKIQINKTSQKEIRSWFGKPSSRSLELDKEKWLYNYIITEANLIPYVSLFIKDTSHHHRLDLVFDRKTKKVIFIDNSIE